MLGVTFLEAKMPLAKRFTLQGVDSYPLAKRFTSYAFELSPDAAGLEQLETSLRHHANKGHCLYKGQLKEPLVEESRAGKTLISGKTQLLVIDIDKYELPNYNTRQAFDADTLRDIAETVISRLPAELNKVSYIAQASSSLGTAADKVSLHLFFFLDAPVAPQMLKWWLTQLNLTSPGFSNQIKLSATGHALHYTVDRCMAENSRIIYIAPPKFVTPLKNPFADDEDRIVRVDKAEPVAHLAAQIERISPPLIQAHIDKAIEALRASAGLEIGSKGRGKVKMMRVGNGTEEQVLLNPDKAVVQYAYHNATFCYANLNDGDSNAYYWPLENPRWIFNFKDEPVFEMAKVDTDFYKWYLQEFREHIVKDAQLKPLVFRDFATDAHYTIEYDPLTDEVVRFATAARQSLEDFCAMYWEPMPDPIQTWDTFFDPRGKPGINFDAQHLNLFYPTRYMAEDGLEAQLADEFKGIAYGYAHPAMEDACPYITKLIFHVLGNSMREFEHFINWFAAAFVHREKTNIAWIFHGIEGTGKGLFYHRVLQRLFGKRYSVMKRINDLEDDFDGWREHNLITVIDEFRIADTSQQSRMHDKIKNMISEPYGSVRYMRANPKEVPLYSNYLFFSNNEDAMRLSATDRRFCVAPRQLVKIDHVVDVAAMLNAIDGELELFAQFMNAFEVDIEQARVALDNDSKQAMRAASNSWVDDFCSAVKSGDFEYFIENALHFQPTRPEDQTLHLTAKRIVSSWALASIQTRSLDVSVAVDDLRVVYILMSGKEARPAEFAKLLNRRGLVSQGRGAKFVNIQWNFADYDLNDLLTQYGNPSQQQELTAATH